MFEKHVSPSFLPSFLFFFLVFFFLIMPERKTVPRKNEDREKSKDNKYIKCEVYIIKLARLVPSGYICKIFLRRRVRLSCWPKASPGMLRLESSGARLDIIILRRREPTPIFSPTAAEILGCTNRAGFPLEQAKGLRPCRETRGEGRAYKRVACVCQDGRQ